MAIKALEANLRRTAVEVEIPAEHGVLLEVTGRHLGVSRRAAELLREINHRYVGWERTLDDLHRHATGDFYVYLQHERGPEGLGLLSTLYRTITEAAEPPETRDRALRLWLSFLEKVAREARADPGGGGAVLKDTIAQLSDLLGRRPSLAAQATHGLKRLTSATAGLGVEAEPALTACRRLLAGTLGRLYHDWLA
ncbi:MAG TPA: hypothetical protein VLA09_10160, partial [Longimicrobiales bacterium]|nr:hypothetical protein [Longimicrobiales bacterium]